MAHKINFSFVNMLIEGNVHSFINRIDPRVRLLIALLYAFCIAFSTRFFPIVLAGPLSFVFVALARLSLKQTFRRLAELNFFMIFLLLFFPFSVQGEALVQWGSMAYSKEGLEKAVLIALKANTIMITVSGLIGTMEPAALGKSMQFFGVPKKFIHIFLFMVRYIDVVGDEFRRLRNAMKLRSFQAKCNLHTFRTYGNLIGMVLVRSLERSERIMAAMKCRGFHGRFYSLTNFHIRMLDFSFLFVCLCFLASLTWLEFFSL
ncbi:MAG: cobalt ECF transporter T component CbiQ [Desulfobulbaceae bacterium]|nr:cobalt ECF transporter T component CbiQ [Desulfobulbaceae bacterium]